MSTFTQNITAVGDNLALTAVVALIPILYFFWALAIKGMKGHIAGLTTLLVAAVTAVVAFKMPTGMVFMSVTQGGIFGILPIGWIIITSVFLYKLTVKTGQFNIIRSSVLSITEDRRIQVLLVAFSFGAFLEGAAGFGAPVAISAALLIGLGFNPLYAAGLSLIANTAPVAFGAIGIPIIAAEGATGIPAMEISKMVGRQLPFLSAFIPFYLVVIMAGFRRAWEIMPAILVSGISFAVTQYLSSNFLGPELPDILSALVSLIAIIILLRFWKPKTIFQFASDKIDRTSQIQSGAVFPQFFFEVFFHAPIPDSINSDLDMVRTNSNPMPFTSSTYPAKLSLAFHNSTSPVCRSFTTNSWSLTAMIILLVSLMCSLIWEPIVFVMIFTP